MRQVYQTAANLELKPIVQTTGQNFDQVVVKSTILTDEQITAAYTAVKDKYGLADAEPMSTATQAATYGNEMKFNTLLFSLIAALLMLIYIWIRFEWRSGIMAVAALTINVLVMLSVYAMFGIPLSTTFIAAILTVLGYSINDTIVIFDRIRENMKYAEKRDGDGGYGAEYLAVYDAYDKYFCYDLDYDCNPIFHGRDRVEGFCAPDYHRCSLRFVYFHFCCKSVVGCVERRKSQGTDQQEKGSKSIMQQSIM